MKQFFLFIVCSLVFHCKISAQVEIFRGNPEDTATYIAPKDTITKPPMFGNDPNDIYRYIEVRYNTSINGGYLNLYADNVKFSFYVERNGKISNFQILSTSHQMVASQIETIITNMPDWEPGRQEGRKKRTLMVYDINIQLVNDIPPVLVTKNGIHSEFSNRHKSLKWFLIGGSLITMLTLWLTAK